MGQEIEKARFSDADFDNFRQRLEAETGLLSRYVRKGVCSSLGPITGFELESWLVDSEMNPAPVNAAFLEAFGGSLACPELAKFNVEFNSVPQFLRGQVLSQLRLDLGELWRKACAAAESLGVELVAIGILPTVPSAVLNLNNISEMNRYRALNEQILSARRQEPLKLDISGHQHLAVEHQDVMLESAATSFQIHLQVPLERVREYFNTAILVSAPLVAVSANSPFLFGKDLWAETRIPLFEQAVDSGGFHEASHGPLHRVGFGSGYARHAITEVFEENFQHYPVLLPILSECPPEQFAHLRLHNGTIWRWNRPLVGFDPDGRPHIRIEHRVIPAGPSIVDMIANAAFFYGLVEAFANEYHEPLIPFAQAKDNFYQAARYGLGAHVIWRDETKLPLKPWLLHELLPKAESGLKRLGLAEADIAYFLGIIEQRILSGQTGSEWQRRFIEKHPGEFSTMTREYLNRQKSGEPVHRWPL
ncbi:glutamate--cysteine ligase [Methylocaldum sp. RMAD-M]|jgi:gamma-glutamyl:cysteine ligase YbdK (ATP-grasp superfamily)|uniref:glutamate--cysteine ligase n=1 Tax=Methylocaldum sp. RMAD-M TaxID=2806557 RepID=UPI000A326FEA|nr:glutamate--cysteine ligase [Methylocaldum sp. RMAD-M]MBP1151477.1 gamma-glutamyl:cysteine ligase YbdK (ATP-grasp superfamily) [Methylocaldum sp. RMAD-M]MVF22638.1 glutamate--cysteine ligase [Methylocaldum sp. BRCS4]